MNNPSEIFAKPKFEETKKLLESFIKNVKDEIPNKTDLLEKLKVELEIKEQAIIIVFLEYSFIAKPRIVRQDNCKDFSIEFRFITNIDNKDIEVCRFYIFPNKDTNYGDIKESCDSDASNLHTDNNIVNFLSMYVLCRLIKSDIFKPYDLNDNS